MARPRNGVSFELVPITAPPTVTLASAIRALAVGGDALAVTGKPRNSVATAASTVKSKSTDGRNYRVAMLPDGRVGIWRTE